jgi:hypothetical protein
MLPQEVLCSESSHLLFICYDRDKRLYHVIRIKYLSLESSNSLSSLLSFHTDTELRKGPHTTLDFFGRTLDKASHTTVKFSNQGD